MYDGCLCSGFILNCCCECMQRETFELVSCEKGHDDTRAADTKLVVLKEVMVIIAMLRLITILVLKCVTMMVAACIDGHVVLIFFSIPTGMESMIDDSFSSAGLSWKRCMYIHIIRGRIGISQKSCC